MYNRRLIPSKLLDCVYIRLGKISKNTQLGSKLTESQPEVGELIMLVNGTSDNSGTFVGKVGSIDLYPLWARITLDPCIDFWNVNNKERVGVLNEHKTFNDRHHEQVWWKKLSALSEWTVGDKYKIDIVGLSAALNSHTNPEDSLNILKFFDANYYRALEQDTTAGLLMSHSQAQRGMSLLPDHLLRDILEFSNRDTDQKAVKRVQDFLNTRRKKAKSAPESLGASHSPSQNAKLQKKEGGRTRRRRRKHRN